MAVMPDSRWRRNAMDDNTRQVLVALIGALGGFLTGVFVAKLGFDHARSTDAARGEREERIRREDDDRRQRERWLADQRHDRRGVRGVDRGADRGRDSDGRPEKSRPRRGSWTASLRSKREDSPRSGLLIRRSLRCGHGRRLSSFHAMSLTAAKAGRTTDELSVIHVGRVVALVDAAAALLRTEIDDGRHADTRTA
jgi:hypothetical protein